MPEQTDWGGWGKIPVDGDVRPFSQIKAARDAAGRNNKRHHFISDTYMDGFSDSTGRIWAYRLENPAAPLHLPPSGIGYERYYYSQKMPDGSQENHRFEDLWNAVETVWPETVHALAARRLSTAISFNVLGMAAIMKARVPAARERNEVLIAAKLRAEFQTLDELGKLPPLLQRYAGQSRTVPIGINPQETLLAMNCEFREFGDLCFRLGFEVLHNTTELAFITSDNPVCFYDPEQDRHSRRPYEHNGYIELIFPLTSKLSLRGSNLLEPSNRILRHRDLTDLNQVALMNQTVAQYAYRLVIAPDRTADGLATSYADIVPTVEVDVCRNAQDIQIAWRHAFGARPSLSPYIDTPEKAARLESSMALRGQ